jgi:superkiller protein 3
MKRLSEELEALARAVRRHDATETLFALSRILQKGNWIWGRPRRARPEGQSEDWAADFLNGVADQLYSSGELRASAEVCEAVVRLRHNDPVALARLSGIAMQQGDLRRAARLVDKAKKGRTTDPLVLVIDGHLALRRGDPGEARERYLASLEHSVSDADRYLALYSLGMLAQGREQFDEAASHFEQAHSVDDTDPYVLAHLAYAEYRLGDAESAEAHYRQALERCDEFPDVWVSLGRLCLKREDGVEARRAFARALELDDSAADAHAGMAEAMVGSDDNEAALPHALRAVELAPDSAYYAGYLGYVYELLHKNEEAESWYRRAVELDKGSAWAWSRLGWVRHAASDYDGAREAFEKTLALDEKDSDAHQGIVEVNCDLGDYEGALPHAVRAVELAPDSAYYAGHLGYVYESLKRDDEAEQWYRRALELDSSWAWAWTKLGWLRYLALDSDDAREAFEKALELDEGDADAHLGMAEVLRETHQLEQVLEHAETAVNIRAAREHYDVLGRVLMDLRRFDEAADAFRSAIAKAPDWAMAHMHLAEALAWQDQYQGAESEYRKAVELDKQDSEIWESLGFFKEQTGDFAEAEELYRRALDLDPGYGRPRCLLARLLVFQGRQDEAWSILSGVDQSSIPAELLAAVLAHMGRNTEAREALGRAEAVGHEDEVDPVVLGLAYEGLGEIEAARSCYERAVLVDDTLAQQRLDLLVHGS